MPLLSSRGFRCTKFSHRVIEFFASLFHALCLAYPTAPGAVG